MSKYLLTFLENNPERKIAEQIDNSLVPDIIHSILIEGEEIICNLQLLEESQNLAFTNKRILSYVHPATRLLYDFSFAPLKAITSLQIESFKPTDGKQEVLLRMSLEGDCNLVFYITESIDMLSAIQKLSAYML